MLFRNLRFYEFTDKKYRPDAAQLIEQLAAAGFEPCRPHQPESIGWVVPDGTDDGNLVLEVGARQLCCLLLEQRPVPAAVVRAEVVQRARKLREAAGGRSPGRRELADLRDAVTADLRPRAFSRLRRHALLLDAENGFVLTDAVTTAAADRLLEATRAAMGSLPFRLPATAKPVAQSLTHWLRGGHLPAPFVIGATAVLRDPRNRQRVIRVRGVDDMATEVAAHLDSGYEVIELEMLWAERLRFRLSEDLSLRSLALLSDEAPADTTDEETGVAEEFAAGALVETATLVQALVQLSAALGVTSPMAAS